METQSPSPEAIYLIGDRLFHGVFDKNGRSVHVWASLGRDTAEEAEQDAIEFANAVDELIAEKTQVVTELQKQVDELKLENMLLRGTVSITK